MKQFLPARSLLFSVLLLVLALFARPASASHVIGGEMTYRYLDADGPLAFPLRYEITLSVYINFCYTCPNPPQVGPPDTAPIAIFDQATRARIVLTNSNLPANSLTTISGSNLLVPQSALLDFTAPPVTVGGCTVSGPQQPYKVAKFVTTVFLPDNGAGFNAVYSLSARNGDITNFAGGGGQSFELYTSMAPRARANRSPIFTNQAVAIICANDTTFYLNNAIDPDGDRLEYTFGRPYIDGLPTTTFNPPPTGVTYTNNTYTPTTPFGAVGPGTGVITTLDSNTGIATLATPNLGKYVIAVDIKEYRTRSTGGEDLIGITRRDVMLVVNTCPPIPKPIIPPATLGGGGGGGGGGATLPRNYTLIAGEVQTIPLTASILLPAAQFPDHPLTLTVNSELLDGTGGYVANFNGNNGTVVGATGTASITSTNGVVNGTFTYTATCDAIRSNPYDIAVTVQDKGCAGKTIYDLFRITVVPPTGPTAIAGDASVCGLTPSTTTSTYTASGGTASKYQWTITGGTIIGSSTASTVQVRWNALGTGTISVQGSSAGGCPAASVTKSVSVLALPALVVTGAGQTVCLGNSATITVSGGGPGAVYTVTGGPVTGTSPTFVLTPTATTTYTITSASSASCPGTTSTVVTVNPRPAANPGQPTRTTCSGVPITLGAPAVTGSTYSWTPAAGLSSTTVANPTVTLFNTTNAAITQTYTLTETNAQGCTATNTVVVTVSPAATAVAGPARAICSGASATLGAAAVTGYTYSWSPSAGLSSATVANPTVTLTNTTGAAITQTYTLTATNGTSCSATSTVVVTVYPQVVPNVGPTTVTTIGGKGIVIGTAPVTGFTYSWTPGDGLSSTTISNPTVLLTNYTGAPITRTYTLTTTNTATGCSGTASVTVTINVDQTLTIYNVITPNGDKLNDKLQILNVLSFPGNTMEIYNRWGRQVFSTTNYNNDTNAWGEDPSIAPGTYYYLFKQTNGSTTKGWVEVIK